MGKSEVYSWRLSRETKAILEDQARRRQTSLASGLPDLIVQEWRRRQEKPDDDSAEQVRLHAAAAKSLAWIAGSRSLQRCAHARRTPAEPYPPAAPCRVAG